MDLTVGKFYSGWQTLNAQLLDRVRTLDPDALGVRPVPEEAYHCGEVSLLLGMRGREPIDLWPPS